MNTGQKIEPWCTPASIGSYDDVWPFKTTPWNLFSKKNFINLKSIPFIPPNFILWISTSCKTLSKALGISKNIPLTSMGGLQLKDE